MLSVEFPQPTIKISSFILIYFKSISHNSGYSPYLKPDRNSQSLTSYNNYSQRIVNDVIIVLVPFKYFFATFLEECVPIIRMTEFFVCFW